MPMPIGFTYKPMSVEPTPLVLAVEALTVDGLSWARAARFVRANARHTTSNCNFIGNNPLTFKTDSANRTRGTPASLFGCTCFQSIGTGAGTHLHITSRRRRVILNRHA